MDVQAALTGFLQIALGHAVVDEPLKVVSHAGLSRLKAGEARQDAVLHHAAHAGNDLFLFAHQNVAGRGTHDHEELAGAGDAHGGYGHMRIHIAHGDGGPGQKAHLLRHGFRQAAGLDTQGVDIGGELFFHDVFHPGIQRLEELLGGVALGAAPDGLVPGRARIAALVASHLPDDPVGRLEETVGLLIDFGVLIHDLHDLGDKPLGGDFAAVAGQESLAARFGDGVELVGLILGRVVFPQLHIGVGLVLILGQKAQRRAVGLGGEHRAGGKVNAYADDVFFIHAGLLQDAGNRIGKHIQIILGMFQRPVGGQNLAAG